MKILPIILLLTCFQVYSQNEYKLLTKKDSASLTAFQFDFRPLEKKLSKLEKVELLKEMIFQLDTSSCYYFTGHESYSEFLENLSGFSDSLPSELDRNIHLVRLNEDNEYDFIYDRLNFEWDFQSIYSMIKRPGSWTIQKIPGFIVVDVKMENEKIVEYYTYQWACCDFPYDYYYRIEQQNDSTILKSKTALSRHSEFPEKISIDSNKKIEMKTDSLCIYSLNNGKIREVYTVDNRILGDFISETNIDGQELVFARFKVNDKKWKNQHFDYFLGWIKKEEINYVW